MIRISNIHVILQEMLSNKYSAKTVLLGGENAFEAFKRTENTHD